jgi:phage-related protein
MWLAVWPGTYEIRIHAQGQWRVIYVAKHGDAVYVLHCFAKKTQQTARVILIWRQNATG